jgi:hypothetical protein
MQLWLDCDSVLADFDAAFEREFSVSAHEAHKQWSSYKFWVAIRSADRFFEQLPLMSDALDLYETVKLLRPIILTGCPQGDWAIPQKLRWRDKHFPGVPMVTCPARDKPLYCQPGDILVNDREANTAGWIAAGGVFILHLSAKSSILELQRKGVIQ